MKWHFDVKRPVYMLDASLALLSNIKELKEITGRGYAQTFIIIGKEMGSYYTPEKEVNEQVRYLTKNLNKTKKILTDFAYFKTKLCNASKQLISKVNKNFYSSALFQNFFDAYRQFVVFRVLTRVLGYNENLPKDFLKKVGALRMEFKNEWTNVRENMEKIWSKTAKHYKVPKQVIKSLTCKEFLDALEKGTFNKEVIKRSKNKVVLFIGKDFENILIGKKAEDFIKEAIGKIKTKKANIINGKIAYPGVVKGIVKVISKPLIRDKKRFILVTSMTTPQFLPILKYVDAIVTDEGGITCHAAIISRELKIPCVVGTQIATSVLKNGDKVLVDAIKGIIRKLKNSN